MSFCRKIDGDWRFHCGDAAGAHEAAFDDSEQFGDGRAVKRGGQYASVYDLCLSHEREWRHVAARPWLAMLGMLLGPVVGLGADWPQWRGLNRDGHSPETGLLTTWGAGGPRRLWVADGLGVGYSSVAVAEGRIYATGMAKDSKDGFISVFDLDGNLQQRICYGAEWSKSYAGGRSAPAVDGDRVYVMTGFGRLVCADHRRGAVLWAEDVAGKFGGIPPVHGFSEAPLIDGDKVICTPGGKDASLVALDKYNGSVVWTSRGFSEPSAYCSPLLVERGGSRQVVTITEKHVVGLDVETGRLIWRQSQDPEAKDPCHAITPVYSDGVIYVTSGHGQGGQLLELSPDGQQIRQKWTDQALNSNFGGVVAVEGCLYGSNSKGMWVCLDITSGRVMHETRGVGGGSVATADGMLYCYGSKGVVGLVRAGSEGGELAGTVKIDRGEGAHWAHPVIAGGRLYIRHGDALLAYAIVR